MQKPANSAALLQLRLLGDTSYVFFRLIPRHFSDGVFKFRPAGKHLVQIELVAADSFSGGEI
jgi:hypothetical protein